MSIQISNNVSQKRQEKGITQEELAQILGVSRQTIIALEKGNYSPSVTLALQISAYFNLTVNDLFYLE